MCEIEALTGPTISCEVEVEMVVSDIMLMNQDLSFWLVQDYKNVEKEREGNVFQNLGLSVNYRDWLVESRSSCQSIPGNSYCTEAIEGPCQQEQAGNISCNSPTFLSIKPIEEITTMTLDHWLCRPQMTLLDQKGPYGKRKLDQEKDDDTETHSSKQKRI